MISDETSNKIKIIIVGDSGVGKTNIRQRLSQNQFDPFSVKTVGVQVSTRQFITTFEDKHQKFTAHFWDVVGQIQNKELYSSFFKAAIGVIYVFDLTNQQSLENIALWKEKVEDETSSKMRSLLLGNKKDLKHLREVSGPEAFQFQNLHKIDLYREVSALDLHGGVEQSVQEFLTICKRDFDWNLRRPTRLRKMEGYHRSCI